ncbi:DUF5335 family protein [Streptomyces sp. NPDC046866]|uniref:DUF5335 family protein n=1 Tax=Streptomyces sp. NPDC046866 TaxID=3154921 RepID=UPI003452E3F8
MTDTSPDRSGWRALLEEVTASHAGELATIEVLDPEIGHQYEAERLPFSYVAYDPKNDVVVVGVGGRPPRYPVVLRHMVPHPKGVDTSTPDVREAAVRVLDPDGTATLITFFPAADTQAPDNGTTR